MLEITAGILMGLAGAMHCVGMCGPLVLFASMGSTKQGSWWTASQYQAGRVVGYIIIGLIVSSTTRLLSYGRYAEAITLIAGMAMIVGSTLQLAFHRNLLPDAVARPLTQMLSVLSGKLGRVNMARTALLRGGLNSMLPCGLSMAAFTACITLPAVWQVIMFMIGFGIGTMPGLLGVVALGSVAKERVLAHMRVVGPVLVIISGVLILFRGMSLGIPFVSPDVNHMVFHSKSGCCSRD